MLFDWYLEIGCRKGRSFSFVRGKTIAVDPFFSLNRNVVNDKPVLHIFQSRSDDFFSSGFLEAMNINVSFTFIDGMHLIEYVLRDFINTERRSHKCGVIAIHDCCPYTLEMTTRDCDPSSKAPWTGDVWKIIPILQHYRPDLKLTVLGCKPTGLLLISNLDPTNTCLSECFDQIRRDWMEVNLQNYGVNRFFERFQYKPVRDLEEEGFPMFEAVRLPHSLVPKPSLVS